MLGSQPELRRLDCEADRTGFEPGLSVGKLWYDLGARLPIPRSSREFHAETNLDYRCSHREKILRYNNIAIGRQAYAVRRQQRRIGKCVSGLGEAFAQPGFSEGTALDLTKNFTRLNTASQR